MVQRENLQGPRLQVSVGPGFRTMRSSGMYDGNVPFYLLSRHPLITELTMPLCLTDMLCINAIYGNVREIKRVHFSDLNDLPRYSILRY